MILIQTSKDLSDFKTFQLSDCGSGVADLHRLCALYRLPNSYFMLGPFPLNFRLVFSSCPQLCTFSLCLPCSVEGSSMFCSGLEISVLCLTLSLPLTPYVQAFSISFWSNFRIYADSGQFPLLPLLPSCPRHHSFLPGSL